MPIKTEDPQALEKLDAKLKKLTELQETMKEINLILRNPKTTKEEKIRLATQKYSLKSETVEKLMNPQYSFEKPGFQQWQLSNNNQEINRLKKRIASIAAYQTEAKAIEEAGELPEFSFEGGKIVDNIPANRLQIFFDGKPDAEVRNKLKMRGFRWAPSCGAWQSYRHQYVFDWAKREFKAGEAQ
ncbi:MAG: hypothetical protein BWY31_03455 [Lentisphaerae bacterium ADurb.Bin242]|nr:MAG: hypothetical protein BWY31_03455 [Lentisphaerae bacterium ADurb.Bin242]